MELCTCKYPLWSTTEYLFTNSVILYCFAFKVPSECCPLDQFRWEKIKMIKLMKSFTAGLTYSRSVTELCTLQFTRMSEIFLVKDQKYIYILILIYSKWQRLFVRDSRIVRLFVTFSTLGIKTGYRMHRHSDFVRLKWSNSQLALR